MGININKALCNKKSFNLSKINFFTSGVPIIIFFSIIVVMLVLMFIMTFSLETNDTSDSLKIFGKHRS